MPGGQLLLVTILFGLAGAVSHEAMHFLVADARGWDTEINWKRLETWADTADPGEWAIVAFAMAPTVTGLLATPIVFSVDWLPLWLWWLVHTVGGIRGDYELASRGGWTEDGLTQLTT